MSMTDFRKKGTFFCVAVFYKMFYKINSNSFLTEKNNKAKQNNRMLVK